MSDLVVSERDELVPWSWLGSCRDCGAPHQWRWICKAPHHVDGNPYQGHDGCSGGTWKDPANGHSFRPRLQPERVDQLRAEYQEHVRHRSGE